MIERIDVAIEGGGVNGLFLGRELALDGINVVIFERANELGDGASGHSSQMIHGGWNQKEGTKKAEWCVAGNIALTKYCEDHGVHIGTDEGKKGILVLATEESQIGDLTELYGRGILNGANVEWREGSKEIKEIEPHAEGYAALYGPDATSFDAMGLLKSLAGEITDSGNGRILFGHEVLSVDEGKSSIKITTSEGEFEADVAVDTAGINATKLAGDLAEDHVTIPFLGGYLKLKDEKKHLINSNIYGVPDLNFSFLDPHLTRRADGVVVAGPTAMLDLRSYKEYARTENFRNMFKDAKIWKQVGKELPRHMFHWLVGRQIMKMVPEIKPWDFERFFSGVRAQAVTKDGELVDDFVINSSDRHIALVNGISPGLTCSPITALKLAAKVRERR